MKSSPTLDMQGNATKSSHRCQKIKRALSTITRMCQAQMAGNRCFALTGLCQANVWSSSPLNDLFTKENVQDLVVPWCVLDARDSSSGALVSQRTRVLTNIGELSVLSSHFSTHGTCCQNSGKPHVFLDSADKIAIGHFWTRFLSNLLQTAGKYGFAPATIVEDESLDFVKRFMFEHRVTKNHANGSRFLLPSQRQYLYKGTGVHSNELYIQKPTVALRRSSKQPAKRTTWALVPNGKVYLLEQFNDMDKAVTPPADAIAILTAMTYDDWGTDVGSTRGVQTYGFIPAKKQTENLDHDLESKEKINYGKKKNAADVEDHWDDCGQELGELDDCGSDTEALLVTPSLSELFSRKLRRKVRRKRTYAAGAASSDDQMPTLIDSSDSQIQTKSGEFCSSDDEIAGQESSNESSISSSPCSSSAETEHFSGFGASGFWRSYYETWEHSGDSHPARHLHSNDKHALNPDSRSDFDCFHEAESYLSSFNTESDDICEIFGGEAGVTKIAIRRRLKTGSNYDITAGFDLLTARDREALLRYLKTKKCRVVIMAPPCTHLGTWFHMNRHRFPGRFNAQRAQAERLASLAAEVATLQLSLGNHFIIVNPLASDIWRLPCFVKLARDHRVVAVTCDQCSQGLRDVDGYHIKKPTRFAASHEMLIKRLRFRCDGEHEHKHLQGKARCVAAQVWPYRLCKNICDGIVELLTMERKRGGRPHPRRAAYPTVVTTPLCDGCRRHLRADGIQHNRIRGQCKFPDVVGVDWACPGCQRRRPRTATWPDGTPMHTEDDTCQWHSRARRTGDDARERSGHDPREPCRPDTTEEHAADTMYPRAGVEEPEDFGTRLPSRSVDPGDSGIPNMGWVVVSVSVSVSVRVLDRVLDRI